VYKKALENGQATAICWLPPEVYSSAGAKYGKRTVPLERFKRSPLLPDFNPLQGGIQEIWEQQRSEAPLS